MHLTRKQTKAIDLLEDHQTTELLFGGGAGGGKSALGCYWQIKRRLRYPGTRGLIGRSELKTLKETTLKTFFEVAAKQNLRPEVHYHYNRTDSLITFYNGSEILLKDLKRYPTDPEFDALGSLEITDAFIDECNQLVEKAWNIVQSRIRFKLDENNLTPKILGTCNPAKNFVYTRFYKPDKARKLPPGRAFVQALVTDNLQNVSRHYVRQLQSLDKASRERLLMGNWEYDDDPSTLIAFEAITDLWSNEHVPGGPPAITCDAARFGSDKAILAVWLGWRLIHWEVWPLSSTVDLARRIKELSLNHSVPASRIVVDEDGVGGGVIDSLRQTYNLHNVRGFMGGSAPLPDPKRNPTKSESASKGTDRPANYANLKTQCYYRLADRINDSGLYVLPNVIVEEEKALLIEELEQVKRRDIDKEGKLYLVSKETVKLRLGRSPDGSDTLMMREYLELTPPPPKPHVRAFRPSSPKSQF